MDVWVYRDYLKMQLKESRDGLTRATRVLTELPKAMKEVRQLRQEAIMSLDRQELDPPASDNAEILEKMRLNYKAIKTTERAVDDFEFCLRLFGLLAGKNNISSGTTNAPY